MDPKLNWDITSRGIEFSIHENTIIISFCHPEARIKDCFLHYAIIDAIKEIFIKANKNIK